MGSAVSALYRFNRCVRAMLTWLVVAALLLTQVPYAHAGEAPTVDDPGVVGAFDLPDESSTDSATSEPKEQATEDAVAAEASEQPSASESSAVDVEDSASNDDGGGIHAPVPLSAASVPVTGFTELSTGGFLPNPGSARNLVIVVRFADDTTGDGNTGYNEPYPYGNGMRTQWERFVRDFNENDPNAYVKSSFREYFTTVSDGRYDVVTDFPQTNPDGTVTYITLPKTRDSYSYDGALVEDAVNEFNKLYPEYDGSVLDTNGDGAVDNVLIVPSVPEGSSITEADILWPHKADYPRSSGLTVGMKGEAPEVGAYNIISTESLDNMGVVAHEYLHSLGIKDYYRGSGDGNPVDVWDIMERSAARSWPLAITRNNLGWTEIQERSAAGTHTLYEPGTGREQAFAFKSPLSDTEYFVVEYRKKNTSVYDLDTHIGGTGLIVYRVNPNFADQGNFSGNDYVYVFRPGETGLGDARGDALNAQVSSKGARMSIGVSDLGADITQGALCYSDGRNSGIVIKATGETADSITFELTYPDYTAADLWDTLAGADGATLPVDVGNVQTVVDGHDMYAAFNLPSSYCIMRYDGSKWHDMGVVARNAYAGTMAVRKGVLYFLSGEANDVVMLRQFENGAWKDVAVMPNTTTANELAMEFVGDTLFAVAGSFGVETIICRLDGSVLEKVSALPTLSIAHPVLFELNGFPAIACGDPLAGKSYVFELAGNKWTPRSEFAEGSSNTNLVARNGDRVYVYQRPGTSSKLLEYNAEGTCLRVIDVSVPSRNVLAGSLVFCAERLYLALLDGIGEVAQVFSSDAANPATWTKLGSDVYKPAVSLSVGAVDDKLIAIATGSVGRIAAFSRTLSPSDVPTVPAKHTAFFKAGDTVVGAVEFVEGDTTISNPPSVPEKEGHTGHWAEYGLGADDLVIEAVYAPNTYTITFKNWDGTTLQTGRHPYGSSVEAPSAFRSSSGGKAYEFAGWSPVFSNKCDQPRDAVYIAQFNERKLASSLSDGDVFGLPAQLAFTGNALCPKPSVIVGVTRLVEGIDYDVSYANNVYVGTAHVIVQGKGSYKNSVVKTFEIIRGAPSVVRLQGPIALDTMKAITAEGFQSGSSSTVVLATTNGYWDALTACGLAGTQGAPVVLTDGSTLSPQAASEIMRLGASTVFVVGGSAAVSDKVVRQVGALSGIKSVTRCAGATATGTAIEIFKGSNEWCDTAIVATSRSFQDALSVAPYAYAKHAPIFLSEASTGVLSDETLTAIRSGGFRRVFVVGGTSAVGAEVRNQLGSLFAGRLSGATAYETSLAIAEWCVSQGMKANNVGIATGESYYDALSGAALCGKSNAVLALASDSNRITIDEFVRSHASQIANAYVFGGPAAISSSSFDVLASALK